MKAIMISIKPRYLAKILNGEKTLEIRTKLPKCDLPIDVYIYCTKDKKYANLINRGGFLTGMVVAKFTLNEIKTVYTIHFPFEYYYKATDLTKMELEKMSCLSQGDLDQYLRKKKGYAWKIDNLKIFEKPKELASFKRVKWDKCGVKDEKGLYQCHKCPYAIIYQKGWAGDCGYDLPLKAPQSWCYTEI